MSDDATLRVRDLGEFGLIGRLQARIEARSKRGVAPLLELGIGDDAAVWHPTSGARQVITTDALVQDVHFRLTTTSWRDLGWKSLAVNVSDLAAMGSAPRYALVSLGLPGSSRLADVLDLYDGMLDLAERCGLAIVGGDVVSAPLLLLNVTVVGEAAGELLRRDAGQVGDLLAVTGMLGASAGGLRLLESGRRPDATSARLFQAHLRPEPRVAEALVLVEAGVRCAMDLSDGLLGDATHICERSALGAVLETQRVPVEPELRSEFGDDALAMAIGGGEDYELLCAAPADVLDAARPALAQLGASLTIVGRLVEPATHGPLVQLVDADGRTVEPGRTSWDHFGD